MKGQHYEHVTR